MKEIKNKEIKRRKSLREKGITLIALVITIIILLILAGVTLNTALSQNGLFQRAKIAGENYKRAESDEEKSISEIEKEIDNIGKSGKTLVQAFKDGEIHVGDYVVNYNDTINNKSATAVIETYETGYEDQQKYSVDLNTTWRVLGLSKDEKNLIITTGSPIKKEGEDPYLYLSGAEGWYNAGVREEGNILDRACKIYAGKYAKETRSIRFEDITVAFGIEIDEENNKAYKVTDEERIDLDDYYGRMMGSEDGYEYKEGDYAPENYLREMYPSKYDMLPEKRVGDRVNEDTGYKFSVNFAVEDDVGIFDKKVISVLFDGTNVQNDGKKPYWLASSGFSNFTGYVFCCGMVIGMEDGYLASTFGMRSIFGYMGFGSPMSTRDGLGVRAVAVLEDNALASSFVFESSGVEVDWEKSFGSVEYKNLEKGLVSLSSLVCKFLSIYILKQE